MAEEKLLIDLTTVKKRQRHYETIFIVSPAVQENIFKDITEKAIRVGSERGAVILRQDDWGKKRMAYAIEKHAMGRYFYLRFVGTEEAVREVERSLKLDANVLRFQTVRLSDPLSTEEIQGLVERAPKEPSSAPTIRGDEDEPNLEASLS